MFGMTKRRTALPSDAAKRTIGFLEGFVDPMVGPLVGHWPSGGSPRKCAGSFASNLSIFQSSWYDVSVMQTMADVVSVITGSVVIFMQCPSTTIRVKFCAHPAGVPPNCDDTSSTVTMTG